MKVNYSPYITILYIFCLLVWSACHPIDKPSQPETASASQALRIISLSGFLTETLFELGYGENIVGRDVTSTYPAAADSIANLGHITQLNLEAILGLRPQVIFIEESQLGQTQVLKQQLPAAVKLAVIPTSHSLFNAVHAAKAISNYLPLDANKLQGLKEQIDRDSLVLAETVAAQTAKPRVLFLYARGAGRLMVGGANTSASMMIEKAGGINAVQSFDNFQALTPEALIEAKPDVILMFTSGLASLDGKAGLSQITGMPQTPAYQQNRIVAMDGHYLTAFGPRAGQAAVELAEFLHPKEL